MTGLVLELQRDALDKSAPVDDLLRKALTVSRKLRLDTVRQWIELELGGYGDFEGDAGELNVKYRLLHGELKQRNPYHGWQPIHILDRKMEELICQRFMPQSVAAIHDLVRDDSALIVMGFSGLQTKQIMEWTGREQEAALFFSRPAVVAVLDAVRNRVLDWALKLEEEGILGEGMSFSKEEKAAASQISYHTHIGSMSNSQVQVNSSGAQKIVQGSEVAKVAEFVGSLSAALDGVELAGESRKELEAEIAKIKAQLESQSPNSSVIKHCLMSAKAILEGAAGNILASGIALQIPTILALLP